MVIVKPYFEQFRLRHLQCADRTYHLAMLYIILYLPVYVMIQSEALLIADVNLRKDVESRVYYEQYDIILTDSQPTQYITSPGFPNELYPGDAQIEYEVKVSLSNHVQQMAARIYIYFELFALELSQDCHKDGFEVLDNATKQLRVYCGSQAGRSLVSEGNALSLRFFSDSENGERGYRIQLSIFYSTCSQEFVEVNSGTFSSPNYPETYIKDDVCVWQIEAPEGKYVRLKFENTFDLMSPDEMCSQDRVLISASGNMEEEFKRYCGKSAPSTIDSTTNVMIVKFRTDCCFEGKGFKVTFGIIDKSPPPTQPPVVLPKDCKCGESFVSEKTRIVGGEEVLPPHLYPWVAGLVNPKNLLYCGATLISDQYVVTAAHCVEGRNSSTVRIVLGAHGRDITSASILLPVEDIIMHEGYNGMRYYNDIAVIRLARKAEFSDKVYPLCLPVKNYQTDGITGVVAGWGRTFYAMADSPVLRHVRVPVIPNAKCVEKYGSRVLDTNVCAGETGKDACGGDSGGPFFTDISGGRWMMVGIVSWGIGCGTDDNPGVFVRVSEYLNWIYSHTGNLCEETVEPPTLPPPPLPNIKDCGIPNENEINRIVGGKETGPFEYPWMALISCEGRIHCVGALVSRRYVLTAVSCLSEWLRENPECLDVFLGEHNLYVKEPYTEAYQVSRVIVYPRYGEAAPYDYDFALLELYVKEDLPEKFRPICIPPFDMRIPDGVELIVAGWGRTFTNGRGSTVLLKTDLRLVNWYTCSEIYGPGLTRNMLCAGNTDKGPCYGDTGAPLMMLIRGRFFVLGITSWIGEEGCAIPGMPSVFSATQSIRSWLTTYARLT